MHGAGNDFVLLPDPSGRLALDARLTRALSGRRHGLGADGVIRLGPPSDAADADVFMDYRNADGSIAEMCGNGVRCAAKYVADRWAAIPDGSGFGPPPGDPDLVRVATRGGVKPVTVQRGADGLVVTCTVAMGLPVPGEVARSLDVGADQVSVTTLSLGNPHAVVEVGDLDATPVARWGPAVARQAAPAGGTNVEFLQVLASDRVRGRIWERGVGETLASGTGGAALAVAAHLLGRAGRQVAVELPGGTLHADWQRDELYLSGPAAEVASGILDPAWLREAAQQ